NKLLLLLLTVFWVSCKQQSKQFKLDTGSETWPIEKEILTNDSSFYYIDVENYFNKENPEELAIGVFDSETGGLTVLDALVRYDKNNNTDQTAGEDGHPDFSKENFI